MTKNYIIIILSLLCFNTIAQDLPSGLVRNQITLIDDGTSDPFLLPVAPNFNYIEGGAFIGIDIFGAQALNTSNGSFQICATTNPTTGQLDAFQGAPDDTPVTCGTSEAPSAVSVRLYYTNSVSGVVSTSDGTVGGSLPGPPNASMAVFSRSDLSKQSENQIFFEIWKNIPSNFTMTEIGVRSNNFVSGGFATCLPQFCSSQTIGTINFSVFDQSDLFFVNTSQLATVCNDEFGIDLTNFISLTGGTFSGPGVSGNLLDARSLPAGDHTITYTLVGDNIEDSENSISISTQFTFNIPGAADVNPGSNFTACLNDSPIPLTGAVPGGGSYSGSGVSTNTFFPDIAGIGTHIITYSVNVNGCPVSNTLTATVIAPIEPTILGDLSACQNSGIVTVSATPAGGVFSGINISSSGQIDTDGASSGTFDITYTVTDVNGCISPTIREFSIDPTPNVSAPDDLTVCTTTETVVIPNGVPAGGVFIPSQGNIINGNEFNQIGIPSGTDVQVEYRVTNANGCVGSDFFTIRIQTDQFVDAGSNLTVCSNDDFLTLTGTPAGGTFSGPGISGSNIFIPSSANIGINTITYTASQGPCIQEDVLIITVNEPEVPQITSSLDVCDNTGLFQIGISLAGGTFTGNNISDSGTIDTDTNPPGSYPFSYTFQDGNNCESIINGSVTIFNNPTVTAASNVFLCDNTQTVQASDGIPINGVFSSSEINISPDGLIDPTGSPEGVFTANYTFTDANGCGGTQPFTISIGGQPETDIRSVQTDSIISEIEVGEGVRFTTSLVDITNINWTFGDGFTSTNEEPVHFFNRTGLQTIVYRYTTAQGCEDLITLENILNVTGEDGIIVSNTELEEKISLSVYPNPASDQLNLSVPESEDYTIAVYSTFGSLMITKDLTLRAGENLILNALEMSQFQPGIYFLNTQSGKNSTNIKFIVQ